MMFADILPDDLRALVVNARNQIAAHPESLEMDDWYTVHPCKTAMCIGGTMAMLADPAGYQKALDRELAGELILESHGATLAPLTKFFLDWRDELPPEHVEPFDDLFHVTSWPPQFIPDGYDETPTKIAAPLALARMEYWMEHGA